MRGVLTVTLSTVVLVMLGPVVALAHGDVKLAEETLRLEPGEAVSFEGGLHYHRLVGQVSGDGPVRLTFRHSATGAEALTFPPSNSHTFNELVRCCGEAWAPHELVIENAHDRAVAVTVRARFVHDDLAVMVDGAESGTRLGIVLLAVGWWAMLRRATRRVGEHMSLRVPAVGLVLLSTFILAVGGYAFMRYGVGGAPAVVAGTGDLPILPINPAVSRASLLMGLSMLGWAFVGYWWVRARSQSDRRLWVGFGLAMLGAAIVVGTVVTAAYGGPLVQAGWLLGAAAPIVAVLLGAGDQMAVPVSKG